MREIARRFGRRGTRLPAGRQGVHVELLEVAQILGARGEPFGVFDVDEGGDRQDDGGAGHGL
jgi:hypothetical protein